METIKKQMPLPAEVLQQVETRKLNLKHLRDIHGELVGEIMKPSTIHNSWEMKVMLKQIDVVVEAIRQVQSEEVRPTFIQRIKVALNRFKISQLFTINTNH